MNNSVIPISTPFKVIVTYLQYTICLTTNIVILCPLVSLFGIITNIINMVVFYKQGLDSSINITLFALAISDISVLVLQQAYSIVVNPWFESLFTQIMPIEFQYLTIGMPKLAFTRITCMITVYMTMERCFCITFPLHVKQMITPRRTGIAMISIYMIIWLTYIPIYGTCYTGWKFYPHRNKTLLGVIFMENSEYLTQISFTLFTFWGFGLFACVVIFTAILIKKLAEKRSWRKKTNTDQVKSEAMSNRDSKTIRMVVLIASILIVCNIPSAITYSVTFFVPEFSTVGLYNHLFWATWSVGFFFETLNSSVNIFLYLKMSSKYRETFHELICFNRKNRIITNKN
jgi:hypothetical protein